MIKLTLEQAQQIEEALEYARNVCAGSNWSTDDTDEALAAIRAARAHEQAEQEPVACPYPCGWDSLISIIIRDGAFLAQTLQEDSLVSGNQRRAVMGLVVYAKKLAILGKKYTAAPQPVQQEPMMDYERINALREGEQNGAEDAYFFVRPENDTPTLRKMFCQGFERGFHKGLKYAAPVQQVDLTDYEIVRLYAESPMCDSEMIAFARAVIAADREKNK